MCRKLGCKFLGLSEYILEQVRDCDKPVDPEIATEEEAKRLRRELKAKSEPFKDQSEQLEAIMTRASKVYPLLQPKPAPKLA